MPNKKTRKSTTKFRNPRFITTVLFALVFAGIGAYMVFGTRAQTATPSITPTVGVNGAVIITHDYLIKQGAAGSYMQHAADGRFNLPVAAGLNNNLINRVNPLGIEVTVYTTDNIQYLSTSCASGITCYPGKVAKPLTNFMQASARPVHAMCLNSKPDFGFNGNGHPLDVKQRVIFTLGLKQVGSYDPFTDVLIVTKFFNGRCGDTLTTNNCVNNESGTAFGTLSFNSSATSWNSVYDYQMSQDPQYCQGNSSPGYTGPANTGVSTGPGTGSSSSSSSSTKSPASTGGTNKTIAKTQGDKPNPSPTTSAQGDQKQTTQEASPFLDGKQYEPGSDSDKGVTGAIRKTGKGVVRLWPYITAAVLALVSLGFLAYRKGLLANLRWPIIRR